MKQSANRQKQTKRSAPSTAWKQGQSGNPSGRPKVDGHVRELARRYTMDAIETLVKIMHDGNETGSARVRAAECILSRGWGQPPAALEVTGAEGGPIEFQEAQHELESILDSIAARSQEGGEAGEFH